MNKKSKVKQVTTNGTWEGNFGLMYKFEVTFENGDTGEYSSKSKDQIKFVEGQETEYEYIDGKFPKVKPVYVKPTGFSNGSNGSVDIQQLIVRQSSLKSAVDLCKGNNCSPEEVCSTAQIFANWVMENNEKKAEKFITEIKKDDLPF